MSGYTTLEVSADPFASLAARAGDSSGPGSYAENKFKHVRRPLRGIQIKDDTYATMYVRDDQGNFLALTNESYQAEGDQGPHHKYTSNFLLQQVVEQRAEKQQLIETFGDSYIFFFGEHPQVLSFQGVLLDTADFRWKAEWWHNYDTFFRGTALVRRRSRLFIEFDDLIVVGYILDSATTKNATSQEMADLRFQLFVTNYFSKHQFSASFPHEASNVAAFTMPIVHDTLAARNRALGLQEYLKEQQTRYSGLLGIVREGVEGVRAVIGAVNDHIQSAANWLYGRRLYVPEGFAGSDVLTGQPTFAAGPLSEEAKQLLTAPKPTGLGRMILIPRPIPRTVSTFGKYRDALDEFPAGFVGEQESMAAEALSGPDVEETLAEAYKLEATIRAKLKKYGINPDTKSGDARKFEMLAGKALFGAVSVGTSYLGK